MNAPYERPALLQDAIRIQEELASRVRTQPPGAGLRRIGGADCCHAPASVLCPAALVVWDPRERKIVECRTALAEVRLPYVPGLLAFREAPAILRVLGLVGNPPQLLICDGHGVAHPRRFGLASHVGVLGDIPTIGCAKRRLCGTFEEPGAERVIVACTARYRLPEPLRLAHHAAAAELREAIGA